LRAQQIYKLTKSHINQVLIGTVLYSVLVYVYIAYNEPLWGYLGYQTDFSWVRYFTALIGVIIIKLITPLRMDGFSTFILSVFSTLTIVTMLSIYAARGFSFWYLLATLSYFWILTTLSQSIRFKFPPRQSSLLGIVIFSLGFLSLIILWVALKGGFNSMNFDVTQIYNLRREAESIYFVGPFAYINHWAVKVFAPILLALGIARRNYIFIFIAIAAEIIFYAVFTHKTAIAFVLFVFFSMWFVPKRSSSSHFEIAILLVLSISIMIYLAGFIVPLALVVNRVFFGPAHNNILYYEFFRDNQFTYFSNSFLVGVVDYPYAMHVRDLISIVRIGETGINPNTGVLGMGFMHLGYVGLLFYALVSSLLIIFIESISKYHPPWVPVAIAGPSFFILLTSTDISVALFTNGLAAAIIMLFFWPGQRIKKTTS
jgi:hypothetical protein